MSAWVGSEKLEYDYDDNGYTIFFQRSYFEESVWVVYFLREWAYDAMGNMLDYAEYSFNIDLGALVGVHRQHYDLYSNGDRRVTYIFDWDFQMAEWVLMQKGFYFYQGSSGQDDRLAMFVHVYPNPTSSRLLLELPAEFSGSYQLFSSSGQVVRKGFTAGSLTIIDMEAIHRGPYILQVTSGMRSGGQVVVDR